MSEEEDDRQSDFPSIEVVNRPDKGHDSSSDVDEQELNRLLGGADKRPAMRMYADEIEEKQKANQ